MKDTLREVWATAQTVGHVLEFVFAGAVVVLFVLVGCLLWAIWTDYRVDAVAAAGARRRARETPLRDLSGRVIG
ncbi:hypothetical protein GCM10022237_39660 [Nocardioides ginsengisoli]|uniref:Uncharacterized protein n=1 Tax=Kribbella ginsengisoli TaxID=363865 RepID=A0ABP6Z7U2_9ACTN